MSITCLATNIIPIIDKQVKNIISTQKKGFYSTMNKTPSYKNLFKTNR